MVHVVLEKMLRYSQIMIATHKLVSLQRNEQLKPASGKSSPDVLGGTNEKMNIWKRFFLSIKTIQTHVKYLRTRTQITRPFIHSVFSASQTLSKGISCRMISSVVLERTKVTRSFASPSSLRSTSSSSSESQFLHLMTIPERTINGFERHDTSRPRDSWRNQDNYTIWWLQLTVCQLRALFALFVKQLVFEHACEMSKWKATKNMIPLLPSYVQHIALEILDRCFHFYPSSFQQHSWEEQYWSYFPLSYRCATSLMKICTC